MPHRVVLVLPIQADPVSLDQTLWVLRSHKIRHEVSRDTRTAVAMAAADPPLLALVQGGRADMALVQAVEKLADVTGQRVPILVLADNINDADEYRLLSCGARDVLNSPVAPTRLRGRILAMRRAAIGDAESARRHTCGALTIDLGRREVSIEGRDIPLTRSEFDLLALLAREPRRVVTRDELAACIGRPGNGKAVESHLSRLRKKVAGLQGIRVIEPVRGVGYRLGSVHAAERVS